MNRILALFRERDTRDELGVGVIRDLLADELFPGTSTIQTRLRYMLLVPWIYRELEAEGWSSRDIAREARKREISLVSGLLESDDTSGVFGKRAGGDLERLPSSVYWSGLGAWGIRRFDVSQEQYHSLIDVVYRARAARTREEQAVRHRGEGSDGIGTVSGVTWHPKLPNTPVDFPTATKITLSADEAHFLQDQVATTQAGSLLAKLFFLPPADVSFPWEHPQLGGFDESHRRLLHHGKLLSDLMFGAALLYNLMLAEQAEDDELVDEHCVTGQDWAGSLDLATLSSWSFDWVAPLCVRHEQAVAPHTFAFCQRLLALVLATGGKLLDDAEARSMVRAREMRLKGPRSRFSNQRAMDQWSGRAGLFRMNYRWPTVRRFVADLHGALQGE